MSTFSVSGLSSGLDTKSIIDQLISIDSRPKTKLQWSQQLATTRQSIWNDLKTRLGAMKTAADALNAVETWQLGAATPGGAWSAVSGDPSRLSATTTGTPTAGTYNIAVQTLAQGEISKSTGNLGAPTTGVRSTGMFQKTGPVAVTGTENLTALRTAANGSTGLTTGSKITMSFTVNGATQNATFVIGTDGTTLTQFKDWVASNVGNGATAMWNAGKLEVTTAPGTNNELSALSFSATTGAGVALANFNSLAGAASSTKVAATNGGVTAPETMTITQGSNSWNVALAVGDQISDIVTKINSVSGIGVIASVSGGALQIQSKTTGTASAFNVTSSGTAAAMLNLAELQTAQDLNYTVDGTAYNNAQNTGVTNGITDVTLNFSAATSTTLTVGQGLPGSTPEKTMEDGIVAKVNAFVSAYNSVLDFINTKTQLESKVTTPADKKNGLSMAEYLQGPMARNYDMQNVSYQLQNQLSNEVSGLPTAGSLLSSIGITSKFASPAAGGSGKLSVDETKLRAAIQADPTAVQNLFGQDSGSASASIGDGFMRRLSKLTGDMTAYSSTIGGSTGIVGGAINSQAAAIKTLQASIDRASDSLDRKRTYYERMYASMETMLGKLQNQGSWLNSQIMSMQNSRN
jgi:flagellar hook-associated protein 2